MGCHWQPGSLTLAIPVGVDVERVRWEPPSSVEPEVLFAMPQVRERMTDGPLVVAVPASWGMKRRWRFACAIRRQGWPMLRMISDTSAVPLWRAFREGMAAAEMVDVAALPVIGSSMEPEEAAGGALLQAGNLSGWSKGPLLLDVTPTDLAIQGENGPVLLARQGTTVPLRQEREITLAGARHYLTLYSLHPDGSTDLARRVRLPVAIPEGKAVSHRVSVDISADNWICIDLENLDNGRQVSRPFLTRIRPPIPSPDAPSGRIEATTQRLCGVLPANRWNRSEPSRAILSEAEIKALLPSLEESGVGDGGEGHATKSRVRTVRCQETSLSPEEIDLLLSGLDDP